VVLDPFDVAGTLPEPTSSSEEAEPVSTGGQEEGVRRFVLKHDDIFVVSDSYGDIRGGTDGLFSEDTRILSCLRVTLGGHRPSLLAAAVSEDNALFTVNLTNRPLPPLGGAATPHGVIHLERSRLLWGGRLYERLTLANFAEMDAVVPLEVRFKADFRDMFEVRGVARMKRGQSLPTDLAQSGVKFSYRGLDKLLRTSTIHFSEFPVRLTAAKAEFFIALAAGTRREIYLEVGGGFEGSPCKARYRAAKARARQNARSIRQRGATIRTSGPLFNDWIVRSRADLALLTTELEAGPYPYAGIPWFSTPFGRDAIITALQVLWLDPSLARGVLNFLALHQAKERSAFQDAAPGKIMHEMRRGEMSVLGELPFGRYYGGVDTTPLFVVLAGAYADRTGDMTLVSHLWPSLVAAMEWIEGDGDSNGDGFVDYARGAETGLANQGWKDSHDSIFHADGRDVVGPVALIEVQGYVYAALNSMAKLATRRGDTDQAIRWKARCEAIRVGVEEKFWVEEMGYYAMAIDGAGSPCCIKGSNAGHLLFSGLPTPERADRVAAHLLTSSFNTGWGLRTLAGGQRRFNPMSYHNGSVWPHDTALCTAGLARFGHRDGVLRLANGLFEAAIQFGMRLPELFCGFPRAAGEAPIAYPVACLPQAWAAGAPFMVLQACLGLRIDGWTGEIHIERPQLPIGLDRLVVRRLAVGSSMVDLTFQRLGGRVVAFADRHGAGSSPILSNL
jgi:glycogen debranching enzyme